MIYLVLRDNKVKFSLPNPTIKADGTVWMQGSPLLGIADQAAKAKAADAIKRKAWNEIPAEAYTRIGSNDNGLIVIEQSKYLAQQKAALTPAQRDRREIHELYAKANQMANSGSEDNVAGPIMLRAKADKMLDAWKAKYPRDAAQEEKERLLDKAQELRRKATSALLYDADGWISKNDQQKRHDDYMRQAEQIEAEAKQI